MTYPKMTRTLALLSTAILPSVAVPAYAQTDQSADDTGVTESEAAEIAGGQPDTVVARVGPVDIRSTEVLTAIGMMPERFQAQPPELLIPIALEQLVLRQLILQQATTQELATDPAIQILAEEAAQAAREDVLVQVWLERELDERVTQEEVQTAYDTLQSGSETELPPLDQVRGQVEQSLRQQEIQTLTEELLESDLVVYYGPDGQPVESGQMNGATSSADQSGDDQDAETGADASTD